MKASTNSEAHYALYHVIVLLETVLVLEKLALQVEEQEKETGVSLIYQWSPKEVTCSG